MIMPASAARLSAESRAAIIKRETIERHREEIIAKINEAIDNGHFYVLLSYELEEELVRELEDNGYKVTIIEHIIKYATSIEW